MNEVRWGHASDFDDVRRLLLEMHAEWSYPIGINEDKVDDVIRRSLDTSGVLVLETDSGQIIGTVGFNVTSLWWSDDLIIEEAWFYITPEHRTWQNFNLLVKRCKELADQSGLPFMLQLHTKHEVDRKLKLFRRSLPLVGGVFMYS